MATAKKSASRKTTATKTARTKRAGKKASAKKISAKTSGSVRKGVPTSKATAKKTGVKRTNVTQYATKTSSTGETTRRRMALAEAKDKKESLIRQKRSTGFGPACWPGYERVAGKEAGTKGSCKPKPNQTAGERKEDARQAAGAKLRKAGGKKARANRMR